MDATAPLPPSNKYMDHCWPRLLHTLTSCLNNGGGTQLGQLLLLLLLGGVQIKLLKVHLNTFRIKGANDQI